MIKGIAMIPFFDWKTFKLLFEYELTLLFTKEYTIFKRIFE
jgi:hypothetical protein